MRTLSLAILALTCLAGTAAASCAGPVEWADSEPTTLVVIERATLGSWSLDATADVRGACGSVGLAATLGDGWVAWMNRTRLVVWEVGAEPPAEWPASWEGVAMEARSFGPPEARLFSVWAGQVLVGDRILDVASGTWSPAHTADGLVVDVDGPYVATLESPPTAGAVPRWSIVDSRTGVRLLEGATSADLGIDPQAALRGIADGRLLFEVADGIQVLTLATGHAESFAAPANTVGWGLGKGWDGTLPGQPPHPIPEGTWLEAADDGLVLVRTFTPGLHGVPIGNATARLQMDDLVPSERAPVLEPEPTWVPPREATGLTSLGLMMVLAFVGLVRVRR